MVALTPALRAKIYQQNFPGTAVIDFTPTQYDQWRKLSCKASFSDCSPGKSSEPHIPSYRTIYGYHPTHARHKTAAQFI